MKWNSKKIILGIGAILGAGFIASTALVSAYHGDPTKQGPNYDADMHDLMTDAFDSADYATWRDLMEDSGHNGRVLEVVNEENFNTFVESHNAALAGDMELANQLRAELGLNNGQGPRDGTGRRGQGRGEGRGQGKAMGGQGQMINQVDFVDADGDGACDNLGTHSAQGQGKGRK